jgi:hypothetical protein
VLCCCCCAKLRQPGQRTRCTAISSPCCSAHSPSQPAPAHPPTQPSHAPVEPGYALRRGLALCKLDNGHPPRLAAGLVVDKANVEHVAVGGAGRLQLCVRGPPLQVADKYRGALACEGSKGIGGRGRRRAGREWRRAGGGGSHRGSGAVRRRLRVCSAAHLRLPDAPSRRFGGLQARGRQLSCGGGGGGHCSTPACCCTCAGACMVTHRSLHCRHSRP